MHAIDDLYAHDGGVNNLPRWSRTSS